MSARAKKFIMPKDDKTVPKQDGMPLSADGEELAITGWWRRRERDGDVEIKDRAPRTRKPKEDAK